MDESKVLVAPKHRDLIIDIGVSDGADSDFYLQKGFRVVGIEADQEMCGKLVRRFANAVGEGRYVLINRAASIRTGEILTFFANRRAQGHSRLMKAGQVPQWEGEVRQVESICWDNIVERFGVPYFVKVDIEGSEGPFLESIIPGRNLPKFFSVEAHSFEPIEALFRIGYRQFRLVNQTLHHIFEAPNPPLEGAFLPGHKFQHSSGLFGEELPGCAWYDFRQICGLWSAIESIRAAGSIIGNVWFDCHAMQPEW